MRGLRNAEVKLDGARFFLELIEERQEEPRSVYHLFSAFLNHLYGMRESLKKESASTSPSFNVWYTEQLGKQDEYREFDAWLNRRGSDVHDRPLPLSVAAVPIKVTSNISRQAIAIKVRKQGTPDTLSEIIVPSGATGIFEDTTNSPRPVSSILGPGRLVAEASPESPSGHDVLVMPRYDYTSRKGRYQDVMRRCRALFMVAEGLLREYRQIQGLSGN